MKNLIIGILLIISIAAVFCIGGCGIAQQMGSGMLNTSQQNVSGGTEDRSDFSAPKTITSKELTDFHTGFFRYGDYVYEQDREYHFTMHLEESGAYVITEDSQSKLQCETDAAFAQKLEQLIREYDLIASNGIRTKTHGLPPEYQPYWLEASYASGEKLSFSMNGDPYAEWTGAVLDLFAREFGAHGITELLPPREDSPMIRFELTYTYDDITCTCSEIWVPITEEEKNRTLEDIAVNGADDDARVKKAYTEQWDRAANAEIGEQKLAAITAEHYEKLQQIVEDTELMTFQNGEILPFNFDYENTPVYYEFYIEYESGKIMSGFSDDPAQCDRFRPVAEQFAAYYETYVDTHQE